MDWQVSALLMQPKSLLHMNQYGQLAQERLQALHRLKKRMHIYAGCWQKWLVLMSLVL